MVRIIARLVCLCSCWMVVSGCAEKNKNMDMSAMKAPPRPAELDKLEPWVGHWEGSGEMTMPDGTKMTSSHTSEIKWELDKRFLVEKGSAKMGNMDPMEMVAVYGWDSVEKEYTTTFYSSFGENSHGEMKFDEKKQQWRMKGRYRDAMSGQTVYGEGILKLTDNNNTMEFTWTQWDGMKLMKQMEMKGTSHRKS